MKYLLRLFPVLIYWNMALAQPAALAALKRADSIVSSNKDNPYDSILFYAQQQMRMARVLKDSFQVARAYLSLSCAYKNSDQFYGEEIASILSAKSIFISLRCEPYIALCNLELGMQLKEMAQNAATPYLFQALGYFKKANDSTNICNTLMELALYHRNHYKEPHYGDSIIFYCHQSLQYATNGFLKNRVYNNLADYYTIHEFEDIREAIRLSKLVIRSMEKNSSNHATALLNLAVAYKAANNDSSFYYLQQGYELTKSIRPIRLFHQANYFLYEHYYQQHDLEKALFHYQQFTQTDRNAKKNIALLEMFLRNESQTALTAKALGELQQKDLTRHKVLLYVVAAFTGVFVLFMMLIFKQNRIIKTDNVSLSRKNKEINSLMREIHHRVKNNLQMIVSLLNLQRSAAKSPDIANVLNDTGTRIKAISSIHQKLYRGNSDMITIGFKGYVLELCEDIIFSYGMSERIDLNANVDEIQISFDNATLIGLLITELITNALKHGVAPGQSGELDLSIERTENGGIKIKLKDDGVGIPESFDLSSQQSFGVDLIRSLVAQLNGRITYYKDNGTLVTIFFPQIGNKK